MLVLQKYVHSFHSIKLLPLDAILNPFAGDLTCEQALMEWIVGICTSDSHLFKLFFTLS